MCSILSIGMIKYTISEIQDTETLVKVPLRFT
jgi:hypothetical protein